VELRILERAALVIQLWTALSSETTKAPYLDCSRRWLTLYSLPPSRSSRAAHPLPKSLSRSLTLPLSRRCVFSYPSLLHFRSICFSSRFRGQASPSAPPILLRSRDSSYYPYSRCFLIYPFFYVHYLREIAPERLHCFACSSHTHVLSVHSTDLLSHFAVELSKGSNLTAWRKAYFFSIF
jgi:hypothetical protein